MRLAEALESDRRPRRLIDQLVGAGSSPGAQFAEADESLSVRDFLKCLGIAAKNLSEVRYWLRVIERMEYVESARLADLRDEAEQLLVITKAIVARTRRNRKPKP